MIFGDEESSKKEAQSEPVAVEDRRNLLCEPHFGENGIHSGEPRYQVEWFKNNQSGTAGIVSSLFTNRGGTFFVCVALKKN
ncbi:hypothetical protein EBO34_19565 [Alteribacter keqinensis]|uniref:Ig-like domain-containing protein n=1 Tax=Alteribacter keqinensis TaxID=2483800 RepID=A0A3M7TNY0_9BACI|nr:hypothetical protein EBO34_19565 [Alteribacter keqinensis]